MKAPLTEAEIDRLRRSGVRLDAAGRFTHEGQEVRHAALRAAFFRWLDRLPDGRYVLRLDAERFAFLDVDDLPFVVRSLRWEGGRAVGVLSDGSEEEIDLCTLRFAGGRPACTVKGGRMPARLSPAAWAALGERLEERDDGVWLVADGGAFRLPPDGDPGAATSG